MPAKKLYTEQELRNRKNAKARQSYQENKGKRAAYHAEWHRKNMENPEYVIKMREKAARYLLEHPNYTSERNAIRRAKDPEKAKRESREWFAKNPHKRAAYEQNRRAKKRGALGVVSPDIKNKLLELQKNKCAICGADLSNLVIHLDHIMPLALGGEHDDKNLQAVCQPCNQTKRSKHPIDFMQSKGLLL